jgi:lipopolysaccharide/colanic/teichoic acid biosynthesis glycosyltransferase
MIHNLYIKVGKRTFDIFLALFSFIFMSPIFVIIGFFIFIFMGRPIIFKQDRPGLNSKLFTIFKFRTMNNSSDKNGVLAQDSERLNYFGNFLRSWSIDELPELWNILTGKMSFVGPRPLLVEYLALYSSQQSRRHEVRPGLTGWAQVNGRNDISWEDKFNLDIWYVDNVSFTLDLKILLKTITYTFKKEGITSKDHATSPKFKSSSEPEPR